MENVKLHPNTTQIPNIILDEWQPELTPAEFHVVMVIARQTYGWHKESDRISYSQMQAKTPYKADALVTAIKSLRSSGRIIVTDEEGNQLRTKEECRGKSLYYRLNLGTIRENREVVSNYTENRNSKNRNTKETYTKTFTNVKGQSSKKTTCPLLNGSPLKAKYIHGHEECVEYLTSEEADRGQKFINKPKQFQCIHKILRAGYGFDVMDKTIRQVEKKYGKGAWDYGTLSNWIEKGSANA